MCFDKSINQDTSSITCFYKYELLINVLYFCGLSCSDIRVHSVTFVKQEKEIKVVRKLYAFCLYVEVLPAIHIVNLYIFIMCM